MPPVLRVLTPPRLAREHLVRREHVGLILAFRCADIERRLATERGLDEPGLGHADDNRLTIVVAIERLLHVKVVPAANRLVLLVTRVDHATAQQCLVERSQALLAVENQPIRGDLTQPLVRSRERPRLEPHVLAAGFEEHHCANRERHRHAREQALDAFVVPHPTALEVGQLELAVFRLREQVMQRRLRALECCAGHWYIPS